MDLFQCQVLHPKYGRFDTLAYCRTDAIMQAAAAWGMSMQEEKECKIALQKEVLCRLRRERGKQ